MMEILSESSRRVIDISPEETVSEAARRMQRMGVGSLVVVEECRPVGIVTDRDLCLRAVAPRVLHEGSRRVSEVMTAPVETLHESATTRDALQMMRTLGIRRLPIVDDGGCLVGLLALEDLLALHTGALHDLAVEGLERRRRAWRDARVDRAREDLERLYGNLVEGMREARWTTQEAFFDEIDALKQRAKDLFSR